jgi:hypothetical protein
MPRFDPPNTKTPDATLFSTRDISTNMTQIDDAIAAIGASPSGDKLSYRQAAIQFKVDRSTLRRRHKEGQTSVEAKNICQRKLHPQQEAELVQYIKDFTKKALPPTRQMIQNFTSQIAGCDVSASWVTQFINRHCINLITKWITSMDYQRHQADSLLKYDLYFDLLHSKMTEYNVQPHNIVNMNEKSFLIGVLSHSKRVFSRELWEKKEVTAALQDGSREWITLLAAICADGEVLPTGIIYASQNSTLRDTWVAGIKAGKHDVFVGSTSSGWSNNDVGLAWLEQVYDCCTKKKARYGRDWRLLIIDGHGSHLTMDFINYCDEHRILLAIMPPHSTHTLQPLDVVMFKLLSTAYSSALTTHLHKSQGLVPIKKGDFFPLF